MSELQRGDGVFGAATLRDGTAFSLPSLRAVVTLRMTRLVTFPFLHGGILNGLLCRALDRHPLPDGVVPFASESGRVAFEAGDTYQFGVTILDRHRDLLPVLESGLAGIGCPSHDRSGSRPVLGGNFEVLGLEIYTGPDALSGLEQRSATGELTLRFLSPLRMQRPKADVRPGKRYLDGTCFPAGQFLFRLWRRLFLLEYGHEATDDEVAAGMPPIPGEVEAADSALLWLDMPIKGVAGGDRGRPDGYTLGGVQGSIRLLNVPAPWRGLLVIGERLHAGEKAHYGFGRYVIDETADLSLDPYRPSRTVGDRLEDAALLKEALRHIATSGDVAGVDGVTPEEAAADASNTAADLVADLQAGTYRPRELLGLFVPKPRGGVRALAVPTVRDRCLQRAACVLLAPAVDVLLEDCSYAYRKGFSRSRAAAAVRHAYDSGYRYVLDADIESFFDAVDWERMTAKLRALFPYEDLVGRIREWLAVPVSYQGRLIQRSQGLPQGAPISPLLANLFLDEFDEELLGRHYRLVRYADDFLVLCRDPGEAERARDDAREALARLGLRLHPQKTTVATFDAGFSYLGYLFCRSTVIEQIKPSPDSESQEEAPVIPKDSWLAQAPFGEIRGLKTAGAGTDRRSPRVVPLVEANPTPRLSDRPVYLSGYGTRVTKQGGLLVVVEEEGGRTEIPLREVSHVVLHGQVGMSLPALLALARDRVPVYACHRNGELDVPLVQQVPDWRLWAAQGAMSDDEARCLAFTRSVVQAKLHNSATIATRFKFTGAENSVPQMRSLERSCLDQQHPDGLRGLEGKGAALFFAMLRDSLPREWGFHHRRRNPPPDPVNAMLSFGYTLLYNHLSTALVAAGLNPRIGFFHAEHGAYHALACDLQEEFRHLVEALVWALIRRHEVGPDDFAASTDGRYPCLMTAGMRRKFIERFEGRLAEGFRPPGQEREMAYREFVNLQAVSVRELVADRRDHYEPLRIHA
ncbi:MAG: CRISPR-associated endonuclease Cas1 [bacterium]|nr:CRISPR-associated endonuclease Cas1 [bacterium]